MTGTFIILLYLSYFNKNSITNDAPVKTIEYSYTVKKIKTPLALFKIYVILT